MSKTAAERAADKVAAETAAAQAESEKVVAWPSDVETMLADADREDSAEESEGEGAGEGPAEDDMPKEGEGNKSGMPDNPTAPDGSSSGEKETDAPLAMSADEKLAEAYRLMREAGVDPEMIMNGSGASSAPEKASGVPWISADHLGRIK